MAEKPAELPCDCDTEQHRELDPDLEYLCEYCIARAYDAGVFQRVAAQGTMRDMIEGRRVPDPPANITRRR